MSGLFPISFVVTDSDFITAAPVGSTALSFPARLYFIKRETVDLGKGGFLPDSFSQQSRGENSAGFCSRFLGRERGEGGKRWEGETRGKEMTQPNGEKYHKCAFIGKGRSNPYREFKNVQRYLF